MEGTPYMEDPQIKQQNDIDSDEEDELKELKEGKFEIINHGFTESAIPHGSTVLICEQGCA